MNVPWTRDRFAGLSSGDEELVGFVILGLPCSIFDDERTAKFIEDGNHLQSWGGDESATVDRFDCRLLLDSPRQLKPKDVISKRIVDEEDELADELWVERFHDLELAMRGSDEMEDQEGEMQGCVVPPPEIATEGAEEARASNAVPFQYPDNNEEPLPEPPPSSHDTSDIPPAPNAAKDLGVIPVASSSFCPPYLVLPDHLKAVNLPTSERQHKIITETAKFLRINGGQVEVLLKVKQASNPNFGFLNHDHPLHPYYRWIVDANPRETTLNSAPDDAEVTHSMAPPPSLSSLQQAAAPSAPSSALPLSSEAPTGALLPWRMIAASGTRADDDHPSGVPSPSKTHEPMTEAPRMDNPQVVAPPVPHPLAPVELNESSEKDIASDWTYEEMLRRRQEGRKSKKKDKRSRRSRSRSRSRSRRRTRRSRSRSRSRSRRRTRRSRSSSSSRSKRQKRRSRSRSASRGRSRGKRSRRRESSSSERRGRSASRPRERRPLDRVGGERPRYDPHSRSRSRGRQDW